MSLVRGKVLNAVIAKVAARLEPVLIISLTLNTHLNVARETANVKIADYGGGIIHRNYYHIELL